MYRRLFALLTIVVILGTAACSSGGAAAGQPSPTANPPTAPVSTAGATSEGCPASTGLPANVNVHGTAVASGNRLSIEASDFFFSPTCVTRVPRGAVTLLVHNGGQVLHNVSIPQLHIDQDMASGQTITVRVTIGSIPLVYFCKYHRSSGMLGALLPSGGGS